MLKNARKSGRPPNPKTLQAFEDVLGGMTVSAAAERHGLVRKSLKIYVERRGGVVNCRIERLVDDHFRKERG